jgi:hypothetical protein
MFLRNISPHLLSRRMKMNATCSCKTSYDFKRARWHYNPGDNTSQARVSEPQISRNGKSESSKVTRGTENNSEEARLSEPRHDHECCSEGKGGRAFLTSRSDESVRFHAPTNSSPFQLDISMLTSTVSLGVMTK